MFEHWTERARRVIFFARYEASQYGSMSIDSEHLLLGLLREDLGLLERFVAGVSRDEIRKRLDENLGTGEKVSTSIDLPLNTDCKRILQHASEESKRLKHSVVGTEHILIGTLLEETCAAARVLRDVGVTLQRVRDEIAQSEPDGRSPSGERMSDVHAAIADIRRRASGNVPDTRFSSTRHEDGSVVVESQQVHNGHRISLTERLRMSDDGSKLLYSVEIFGPRTHQHHKHSMEFDVS